MNMFEDRERAYEKRFCDDLELEFKSMARRNKLLGLWAAELMGYDSARAQDYAGQIVDAAFVARGRDAVFERVWGDLSAAKVEVTDRQVRRHMDRLMRRARQQIHDEAYDISETAPAH